MAYMTKRQKSYIEDIEKNLKVKYAGYNTRKEADKFIQIHAEANREFQKVRKISTPPTGKQMRYIKDIEAVLEIKFTGKTLKEAIKFINDYYLDYATEAPFDYKIKNYYNNLSAAM